MVRRRNLADGSSQQQTADALKKTLAYWIDSDTPKEKQTIKPVSSSSQDYILVASDEFGNAELNSKFWEKSEKPFGDTPMVDFKNDAVSLGSDKSTKALQVKVSKGNDNRYIGGQLGSWNRFCFTGGVLEVRAKVPDVEGPWSAVYMIGNLARSGYEKTATYVWPWTYNLCDNSATKQTFKNKCGSQYATEEQMKLLGSNSRGAPGLNLFQSAIENSKKLVVSSVDIAPRIPDYFRPEQGKDPSSKVGEKGSWYRDIKFSGVHNRFYGFDTTDAITGAGQIEKADGDGYNIYTMEWVPGTKNGYVSFYMDGNLLLKVPSSALGSYEDPSDSSKAVGERVFFEEPQAIYIRNTLASGAFWKKAFPSTDRVDKKDGVLSIDYVRLYQPPDQVNIGCNPPNFQTTAYINKHAGDYEVDLSRGPVPAEAEFYYNAPLNPSSGGSATTSPGTTGGSSASGPDESETDSNVDGIIGRIFGIGGGIAGLLILLIALFVCNRKRAAKREDSNYKGPAPDPNNTPSSTNFVAQEPSNPPQRLEAGASMLPPSQPQQQPYTYYGNEPNRNASALSVPAQPANYADIASGSAAVSRPSSKETQAQGAGLIAPSAILPNAATAMPIQQSEGSNNSIYEAQVVQMAPESYNEDSQSCCLGCGAGPLAPGVLQCNRCLWSCRRCGAGPLQEGLTLCHPCAQQPIVAYPVNRNPPAPLQMALEDSSPGQQRQGPHQHPDGQGPPSSRQRRAGQGGNRYSATFDGLL